MFIVFQDYAGANFDEMFRFELSKLFNIGFYRFISFHF